MGKRGREQTHQEITGPQLQPVTTGKDNNNAELSVRSKGFKLHTRHTNSDSIQEKKNPKHCTLKINADYIQKNYKNIGNRKPPLKVLLYRITQPRHQSKTINLKGIYTISK